MTCKKHPHLPLSGIGLVEIIVSVSIISLSLVGILGAFNFYLKAGVDNIDKIKAAYLLEEGVEAVRFLRDEGWTANIANLSTSTEYHLAVNGSQWESTTTPLLIDSVFDRVLMLDDVYRRNSDDDIVASTSPEAKTLDEDARQVTVRVSWNTNEIDIVTYMTNLFE